MSQVRREFKAYEVGGEWPAMAYIYGTFGYALTETITRAFARKQKMYIRKVTVEGMPVWMASWDPRKVKA